MATAVARPTGAAVRQRDRLPKLSLSKRGSGLDGDRSSDALPQKKRKLTEPFVRDTAYILRKHKGKPPSIVLHLHNTHFKFHGQEGSYAYDSPMKFVLEHLRKGTVPHEMIEELLVSGVPWYDGCLIVEVRNYKTKEGEDTVGNGKKDGGGPDGKFSMHRYNEHITPSAFAPYPNKAKSAEEQGTKDGSSNSGTPEKEKEKSKEKASKDGGPQIFTTVLHPTALTQHHEIMLLANTPASELRSNNKKKGSTDVTGASQPPTPSVPPTPTATSRGPLSQQQNMCLEEGDIYAFQSDLLLATEPPLLLDPVSTPQDADRVLEILSDPLHCATPPEAKTRKRTTAEMAADDAQAAEQERRMLIMDERLKPLSTSTAAGGLQGDGQGGAAAALGFSRFKTLEMVRAKHEEQERVRKDEEARQAVERKAAEEQNQRQQALLQHQAKQKEMLLQQQRAHAAAQGGGNPNMMAQRNEMLRQQQQQQQQRQQMEQAQQLAAQQATSAQHGHPQQQNTQAMMQQGGQGFQQPQQVSQMGGAQGSPLARQQTPMLNSSPMMPQGGFPMQPQGSNQGGAGSPARPTSAMMAWRNVSMARQGSQQQGSTHNTPQIAQGTPSMPQAMPNRQMSQTPRLPPGSPAAGMQMGTPNSAHMASMQPTPHMNGSQNGFTPEQLAMLQRQQSIQQQQQHSASPAPGAGGQGGLPQNMTPEQFQAISVQGQQRMRHQQQQLMMAQRSGNQPLANHWQMQMQQQQNREMQARRIREMHALQQAQQQGMAGGGGGHGHPQQTPGGHPQMQPNQMQNQMQVNQHPQQMQSGQGGNPQQMATPDQMAQAQQRSQQMAFQRQLSNQLSTYAQQYGGWQNIPQQAVQTMPPALQNFLRQQKMRAQQQQQQGQMSQAQMQQQQMRMLQMQQQQQQQQQGNMGNGGGMGGGGGNQGGAAGGDNVVPAGAPNPQYMQALRSNRDALAQQMQMQGHMQNMQQQNNGMGMAGMRGGPQGGGGGGGGGGAGQNGDDLQQHFANMANALQRPGV